MKKVQVMRAEMLTAVAAILMAVVMFGSQEEDMSPKGLAMAMKNLYAVNDAFSRNGTIPALASIPPAGPERNAQKDVQRFNKALVRLCRSKKVPISYCFEEIMAADLDKAFSEDGLSLSPQGYLLAGQALRKTFEQIYFAIRDTSATMR